MNMIRKRARFAVVVIAVLGTGAVFARNTVNTYEYPQIEVGAGFGIHYGLLGANAELFFNDRISLSAGAGRGYEFAYDLAFNYYFVGDPQRWRPRVSIDYGTFDQVRTTTSTSQSFFSYNSSGHRSFETFSAGVGIKKLWGRKNRNGFDADVNYSLQTPPSNYPSYDRIVPSIGYVYRF